MVFQGVPSSCKALQGISRRSKVFLGIQRCSNMFKGAPQAFQGHFWGVPRRSTAMEHIGTQLNALEHLGKSLEHL